MKSNNLNRQRGVGLLELMLALAIATILIVLSFRTYQTFRIQGDVHVIVETSQAILAAASAYYAANCSDPSRLKLGEWQSVGMLADFLPGSATLDNPWGVPYSPGVYYQIQFMQISPSNNIVFCVQTDLVPTHVASQYYQFFGAATYVDAPSSLGVFCQALGTNSIVWQSLPSVDGVLDSQVTEGLKAYRKANNINPSSLCPS